MLEILNKLYRELEINSSSEDEKLQRYIRIATKVIQNYLNNDTFDDIYIQTNFSDAIIEMVVNAYNVKNNTQAGVKQITQGSRSTVYRDDTATFVIDETIKSLLPKPYIKLM